MEQMTVCEYCGTEIPHISASWTDDGSSYCEGCHPRSAQSCIAELEAEVERLQGELKWTRDKLQEAGTHIDALGLSLAGSVMELEVGTHAAWNDAIDAAYTATVIWMHDSDDARDAFELFKGLKRGQHNE